MADFTFGQAEAVLSRVNRVADHKRAAFVSRLKFLQKHGVPRRRARPGRGKAGIFSFSEVVQLGGALELLQSGLTPQKAGRMISDNWYELDRTIEPVLNSDLPVGSRCFWVFSPSELADLMKYGADFQSYNVTCMDAEKISDYLIGGRKSVFNRRTLIINSGALVREIIRIICDDGFSTREEIRDSLIKEAEVEIARGAEVSNIITTAMMNYVSDESLLDVMRHNLTNPSNSRLVVGPQIANAKTSLMRLSIPALKLFRHIAIVFWGSSIAGEESLFERAQPPQFFAQKDWRAYVAVEVEELVSRGLVVPFDDASPLGLTSQGVIAAMVICKRQVDLEDPDVNSET